MSEPFFSSTQGSYKTIYVGTGSPMIYNDSSAGETYLDVAGDTYAELPSQTRTTLSSDLKATPGYFSGHVDAGTGTFQLWNHTDSTQIASANTTATSETPLSFSGTANANNAGDEITIRVKNSGAGNSVTLDSGGFVSEVVGATTISSAGLSSMSPIGTNQTLVFVRNLKFMPLKRKSAATFSGSVGNFYPTLSSPSSIVSGDKNVSFDETDNGTLLEIDIDPISSSTSSIPNSLSVAATLDTTSMAFAFAYDLGQPVLY